MSDGRYVELNLPIVILSVSKTEVTLLCVSEAEASLLASVPVICLKLGFVVVFYSTFLQVIY